MQARAAADALWEVSGIALGAQIGTSSFNVMAGTEFSSFLRPQDDDANVFRQMNSIERSIDVEVSTIDAILPALREIRPIRRIYLKMDTQGFDLDVLRGAGASLEWVAALQSEAAIQRIYFDAPNLAESIHTIEGMDFSLSGIFPNNDGHFPSLVEVDCVFIANRHLS